MPERKHFGKKYGPNVRSALRLGFNPLVLDDFIDYVGQKGVSRGAALWILYLGMFWVLSLQIPHLILFTTMWVIGTAPIWLPVGLYYAALRAWVWYIQSFYIAGQEKVLLEVKMPREITKSPRAMELALIPFTLSAGETTFIHRGWQGGVRPFWSLEIASFGGDVHFYVWTWKGFRNTVESTMYAYYPEVELHEVEDYALKFKFDPKIHDCYATDWHLETYNTKEIPGRLGGSDNPRINAYPFRSYVDFELDKDPKEEFKVDPLAQVVEFLGGIRPEDQIWVQIVIRAAWWQGVFRTRNDADKWRVMVEREVEQVRVQSAVFGEGARLTPEQERIARPRPTWLQLYKMETMQRNLSKYAFEFGVRGWIVSTKELTTSYWQGMRWMWRAVGSPQNMTHLRPRRWHPPFDWPWQDYKNIRWNTAARRFLDAYRRRLFYHSPWIIPTNILTNEAIATIWHPISSSIATPGVERIPAKKAEPPSNLPV